jgi:hypothetical protein
MDDLTTLDVFAANARREFQERAARGATERSWFQRLVPRFAPALAFSGALNLALLAVVGYGALSVVPSFRSRMAAIEEPRAAQTFIVRGVSRGAAEIHTVSRSGALPVFRFDLPQQFRAYRYTIEGGPDRLVRSGPLNLSPGAETVDLTIPAAALAPGDYTGRVSGAGDSGLQEIGAWVIRVVP